MGIFPQNEMGSQMTIKKIVHKWETCLGLLVERVPSSISASVQGHYRRRLNLACISSSGLKVSNLKRGI